MWNFLCSSNVKIRFEKKKQKIRYKVELKSTDEEGMGYGHPQVG